MNEPFSGEAAATEEPKREESETKASAASGVWDAVNKGAKDAVHLAATYLPLAGTVAAKSVYAGCYAASFGITFGALTAKRFLPLDELSQAIQQGAQAAKAKFEKAPEPETPASEATHVHIS